MVMLPEMVKAPQMVGLAPILSTSHPLPQAIIKHGTRDNESTLFAHAELKPCTSTRYKGSMLYMPKVVPTAAANKKASSQNWDRLKMFRIKAGPGASPVKFPP
jgi:hypothetical protein